MTRPLGRNWIRCFTSSNVAWSAQCRSSITSRRGRYRATDRQPRLDCLEQAVAFGVGLVREGVEGAPRRSHPTAGPDGRGHPGSRRARSGSGDSWRTKYSSAVPKGWNGAPSSSQRPANTSGGTPSTAPSALTRRASSWASRVLPAPGSPASSVTAKPPVAPTFHDWRTCSKISARPRTGTRNRPAPREGRHRGRRGLADRLPRHRAGGHGVRKTLQRQLDRATRTCAHPVRERVAPPRRCTRWLRVRRPTRVAAPPPPPIRNSRRRRT